MALLLLPFIMLAGCTRTLTLPALKPGSVILAFGDSLTYGTGAPQSMSYPDQLSAQIGFPVLNAGIPGERSAQGLARLPAVMDQSKPALLILCHGANDLLAGSDLAAARANVQAMIREAKSRGVPVLLIGVPKISSVLKEMPFYAELAQEEAVLYEGKILPSILARAELKSDLIHPNAAGYGQLASAITQVLKRSGAVH
jgi:acyl-CoA thioesterase I